MVNRIGYGAMRLTGDRQWGDFPGCAAGIALHRRAVESGVTYIDTADAYGPHTNETLIRDALHPYPTSSSSRPRAASSGADPTTRISGLSAIGSSWCPSVV